MADAPSSLGGGSAAALPGTRRRRLSRPLVSTNAALRSRLDDLARYAAANDVDAFLAVFVPIDLSAADTALYKAQLANNGGAEWANLVVEINAMREGALVVAIGGDQRTEALFTFTHPLEPACEREVRFVCAPGSDDWRADG